MVHVRESEICKLTAGLPAGLEGVTAGAGLASRYEKARVRYRQLAREGGRMSGLPRSGAGEQVVLERGSASVIHATAAALRLLVA